MNISDCFLKYSLVVPGYKHSLFTFSPLMLKITSLNWQWRDCYPHGTGLEAEDYKSCHLLKIGNYFGMRKRIALIQ
jgi:hypothetical protein